MSPEKDSNFVSLINSIKEDLTSLVKSSGLFVTAIAMLNLAVVFVFIAVAYYLNTLGYELWVSFLFVVGGLTLGGVLLGLLAMRQASKITFGTKTAKSVSDTVETITSLRSGSK
jgi:Flp pilus assembly protein TadB